jgi:preprotein translocase subunit YajC
MEIYNMFLISAAFASSAPSVPVSSGPGFDPIQFLPLIGIFAVFYFLLIRPQQQKAKQHQELLSKLNKGDRVVTSGGIIGVIHKIENEKEVILEVAENVRLRVLRANIVEVPSKTEHASQVSSDKSQSKNKSA